MHLLFNFLILLLPLYSHGSVDLEKYCQDFVLETKQIIIPEYPHAFNPSIIRWNGKLLLSFRVITSPSEKAIIPSSAMDSKVGLVWLDDEYHVESAAQILELDDGDFFPEDGRLICTHDQLYLIYSSSSPNLIGPSGFFIHVAELSFDGSNFHIIHNECLSSFDGAKRNHREKNWVPYIYEDKLQLAYQLAPHIHFSPILDGSGICKTVAASAPSIVWEWGELRGGTPALVLDNNTYLSFFHSSTIMQSKHSNNKAIPHYFMGAYTFSRTPPFQMLQISPEPIVGKHFYTGKSYTPYWHPVQVAFPCGLTMDDQTVWVTYGRQDHECWVVKIDKQGLLDSLIQVSTFPLVSSEG